MTQPVSVVCHTLVVAALLLVPPATLRAEDTAEVRLFLNDGSSIVTYGEYSRTGDRVVFSVNFGEAGGATRLQLVSLPATQVDWTRSERYLESVRAARYAATRGEHDFAMMTGEVARVLNEIALAADPGRKLQLAESARRMLDAWPREHYGYKAREVQEIGWLLDDAVAELRARAGQPDLDLALVAPVVQPAERLLPPVTDAERIAQALSLADLVDNPDEREALLESTLQYIGSQTAGAISGAALERAREHAQARLTAERAVSRAYQRLVLDTRRQLERHAARADVRGLSRLAERLQRQDRRLGGQRPAVVRALLTDVHARLDSARRLRLARDRWAARVALYRSYTGVVKKPVDQLVALGPELEEIRELAGPSAEALARLADRSAHIGRQLHAVVPPADLAPVHALFVSACELAGNAARIRREAVRAGEMTVAWNASAAASGSLMLLARAQRELEALLAPPTAR